MKKIESDQRGVTLLEVIVGIALVSLTTLSLYFVLFNAARLMGDSKQKIGAVALANERMEIIRNLDYDSIGTEGWIPAGPIPQSEVVEKNNFTYTVDTTIEYIDDVFDGQGGDDAIENDYKHAWVEVSWVSGETTKSVLFTSRFVPPGLETDVGGGVLSINVIDGEASQIEGATVQVDSVDESPPIHGSTATDSTGNVRLPGMPEQDYKLTVSASDYETVETYPNPPGSPFTPNNSHVHVVEGSTVLKTIEINKSADLMFKTVDVADGDGISGIDLDVFGGSIIGSDPTTYAIDETQTTDSDGEVEYDDIGTGTYDILNLATLDTVDYQYVGSDEEIPIALDAEDDLTVNLVFAEKNINSILVRVVDSVTLEALNGAEVNVTGTDFDQTAITSTNGFAYLPLTEDPPIVMNVEEYDVSIITVGYQNYSQSVDVENLTILDAELTPQ